jgi:hypothetical protein
MTRAALVFLAIAAALSACREQDPGRRARGLGDAETILLDAGGGANDGGDDDSGRGIKDADTTPPPLDSGTGVQDASMDAGADAGGRDAAVDAGADAGVDAGIDAGADAGTASDAGIPGSGEIWVEIDYSNASGPQSPSWSYSATPGWGEAQWAMAGDSWPEAWDRWNNMAVVNDPIGTVLEIGSGSELQLMIGLEELVNYTSATVRIEGRSRSATSSVDFDVYNPLINCGVSTSMAHDWTVHVVEVDLMSCMSVGQGVQAVRIEPTNGTVALVRMRLTLHGASW